MAANSRLEKAGRSCGLGNRNVATALGYGWVGVGGHLNLCLLPPASILLLVLPIS